MLTINDCTLDQKNDGTDVQADGDDNFEHNAFLFGAKVNPACAKPLRKRGPKCRRSAKIGRPATSERTEARLPSPVKEKMQTCNAVCEREIGCQGDSIPLRFIPAPPTVHCVLFIGLRPQKRTRIRRAPPPALVRGCTSPLAPYLPSRISVRTKTHVFGVRGSPTFFL